MTDQLPAIIQPGALIAPTDTYIVPALIAAAGDQAGWRYVEFFTANIHNDHTRRAYARACGRFFAWCEQRGLTLTAIRPFDVAAWVKELDEHSAPSVKQQLAAVRMLFDWLVIGQVVPMNPAAAVRGPKHVVKTGKTPVLDAAEWRKLIDSIPTETVRDLRDRALIATLTYSFARITAALRMKVEDLRPQGRRLADSAARERRQAARDAVPSRARRGAARLHRCRRHRRGSQGLAVPHQPAAQRDGVDRAADGAGGRLAHDPPSRRGGRHPCAHRQPHVSRDRDHRLSRQWRRA